MNVKNLMKQCEMVIKLSNGVINNEIDYLYNTAKSMVENDESKSKHLVFRNTPDEVNLTDLCNYMRNLCVWNFFVVGDMETQFKWQKVANPREIVQVGNEYAMKFRV